MDNYRVLPQYIQIALRSSSHCSEPLHSHVYADDNNDPKASTYMQINCKFTWSLSSVREMCWLSSLEANILHGHRFIQFERACNNNQHVGIVFFTPVKQIAHSESGTLNLFFYHSKSTKITFDSKCGNFCVFFPMLLSASEQSAAPRRSHTHAHISWLYTKKVAKDNGN